MNKPSPYLGLSAAPVRPGATDALKIPSLDKGQRIERKPPAAMCVGVAKVFTGAAK